MGKQITQKYSKEKKAVKRSRKAFGRKKGWRNFPGEKALKTENQKLNETMLEVISMKDLQLLMMKASSVIGANVCIQFISMNYWETFENFLNVE